MYHPKAPLGYTGGKTLLRRKILPYFPPLASSYYEPFLGGGSVFVSAWWNLYRDIPCYLSDIDDDLMTFYRVVRDSPKRLIELILGELDHWQGNYREMIEYLNTKSAYISVAAKVWLYSRFCFGSMQKHNAYSKYKATKAPSIKKGVISRIEKLSMILRQSNITLKHQCAFEAIENAIPHSFFYLDPPYPGAERVYKTQTFDHAQLYHSLENAPEGTKWILSYRDDAFIRGLYDKHSIIELEHTYMFMPNHDPTLANRPVTELLISNFPIDPPIQQLAFDI